MVLENGELRWPPPPGIIPATNTKVNVEKETKKETGPVYEPTRKNAMAASTAVAGERPPPAVPVVQSAAA